MLPLPGLEHESDLSVALSSSLYFLLIILFIFFLLFNERKSQGRLAFIFGAEDGKASLLSKKRCSYELGLVGLHLIVAVMEEHSFMVQGFRKREQALWICAN